MKTEVKNNCNEEFNHAKRFGKIFCVYKIVRIIAICIIFVVCCFILDLLDLPSRIGLNMDHVNWDAMSLICGNIVVIGIAVITYYLINKRQKDREINQRDSAIYMLDDAYELCITYLEQLTDEEFIKIYIHQSSDLPPYKDPSNLYYKDAPFETEKDILEFLKEGIITDREYSKYSALKVLYQSHVLNRLVEICERKECNPSKENFLIAMIEDEQLRLKQEASA